MKKASLYVLICVVILFVASFIKVRTENDRLQKKIDQTFTDSYHIVTLNLLNETVCGENEAALHMYKTENTIHAYTLANLYPLTSFVKNKNTDLNYVISALSQSAGYRAVTEINMTRALYTSLKAVSTNEFNDKDILKQAKADLEKELH